MRILADIDDPTANSLRSVIEEELGKPIKSFDTIKDSVEQAKIQSIPPRKAAMLYNNYARVSALRGNLIQAELYFLEAIKQLKICKDVYLYATVYENLIFNALRQNKTDFAEQKFEEFNDLIKRFKNKYLQLEYINLKLQYAAQLDQTDNIRKIVDSVIAESKSLSQRERISLLISASRISYNHRLKCDQILSAINDAYFMVESETPGLRFFYNKELFYILNGYAIFNCESVSALKGKVELYYKNSAYNDYAQHLQSVSEYSVRERIEWLKNGLFLENTVKRICDFNKTQTTFNQIIALCFDNGLWFTGVRTQLDFINESFAPYNVVNTHAFIPQSKYSNEIFEVYKSVCSEIKGYHNDPRFADIWIQLGTYSICLGQPDEAKAFIQKFECLNISVNHFSDYIQDQYRWSKSLLKGI